MDLSCCAHTTEDPSGILVGEIAKDFNRAWFLYDQINLTNTVKLMPCDYLLSMPEFYLSETDLTINTKIILTPKFSNDFNSPLTIYYRRIDIAEVLSKQNARLELERTARKVSDILDQFNEAYDLDLTADDITDADLPTVAIDGTTVEPVSVPIAIRSNNLKYFGTYDYVLNYVNNAEILDQDSQSKQRLLMVYRRSMVDLTNLAKNNLVIKVSLDGRLDTSFALGRNASNVTEFNIEQAIYDAENAQLVIAGTFSLTYTIGMVTNTGTWSKLTLDLDGSIAAASTEPLLEISTGYEAVVNRDRRYTYVFDSNSTDVSTALKRLRSNGQIDPTFDLTLQYIPRSVFVQASGAIYTVSPSFKAINPTDPNATVPTDLVRIDRYTEAGVDSTFNSVYLTSSVYEHAIPTVTDILESPNGLISILVNQPTGFDVGTNTLVVNSRSLVATYNNGNAKTPWIPIVSLLHNGLPNKPFNNTLNQVSVRVIATDPGKTNQPNTWLHHANGHVVMLGYFNNPYSALPSYGLVRFDSLGNYVPYDIHCYMNWPVYETCIINGVYSDGSYVISGQLAALFISGVLTAKRPMATLIRPDGQSVTPQIVKTGVFPQETISLIDVFIL